jgi:SAM-dependent methyltransferase
MNDPEKLHGALRAFYNNSAAYFEEAGDANNELTPERRHLFSFIPDGALTLDVGCGQCENAGFLAGKIRYVACDLSHLAIERASAMGRPLWAAVQAESQALPFATGSMDVVMSTYALEHFVYPRESLAEMYRVCRSGGRVLVVSPAYDHPLHLPPSIGHWPAARRRRLAATQFVRQAMRHLRPNQYYFARISAPRVLDGEYQPDFDAVHLVSAREVSNFFKSLGARILFERKREARDDARTLRERLRNIMLRAGIGEYAGLNLQIVVEKP